MFLQVAAATGALVGVAPAKRWAAAAEADPQSAEQASKQISKLWGEAGELWSPDGRLPDFSFAGYRHGETPIPTIPVVANVRDFGAIGDGQHDDTAAFQRAISETSNGAILLPAGRYRITDFLEFRRPNIVLRGQGPDQSTLVCPIPLNEIRPNWGATTGGRRTSNYSWSGGIVSVRGNFRSTELATITQPAQRGSRTVRVEDASRLIAGQLVELHQRDDQHNSLAIYLYANQPGSIEQLNSRTQVSLTARIEQIDGNNVTLDRYLPFDVQPRWQPRLLRFDPTVTGVGIEDLAFEFPVKPYGGHFTELGHNALSFSNVADCWARNLQILHSDSGIFVHGRFLTLDNVVLISDRDPERSRKATGHHGVSVSGHDNLVTRFDFRTRFMHDITVTAHASGNVFSAGRGIDLCFDHHKRAPFANLYTEIDIGQGTRMFQSGGGADLGRHSAAWTTFWNIRAAQPQRWPPSSFGPDTMNFVAASIDGPQILEQNGKWCEIIDPQRIRPQNLHQAQLQRRLQRKSEKTDA